MEYLRYYGTTTGRQMKQPSHNFKKACCMEGPCHVRPYTMIHWILKTLEDESVSPLSHCDDTLVKFPCGPHRPSFDCKPLRALQQRQLTYPVRITSHLNMLVHSTGMSERSYLDSTVVTKGRVHYPDSHL
jgi:hypothetical protein